jgi:hypothetical protein
MNFRSIRDKRIDKFGKKKKMALALPTGAKLQQALFIFFYCVQAETKKKNKWRKLLFFFNLPA